MGSLLFLVIIGTSICVYADARALGAKRGRLKGLLDMGPAGWFWVTLLFWIIGFPAWLVTRGKYKQANIDSGEPDKMADLITAANELKKAADQKTVAKNAPLKPDMSVFGWTAGIIFGISIIALIVSGLSGHSNGPSNASTEIQAPAPGPEAVSAKSDHDLYLSFYTEISGKMAAFDNKYERLIKQVSKGDYLGAIIVASELENELNQLQLSIGDTTVPELKNAEALKGLNEAKALLSAAYLSKWGVVYGLIEYSKTPSAYQAARVKSLAEKSQAQQTYGFARLADVGLKVGGDRLRNPSG